MENRLDKLVKELLIIDDNDEFKRLRAIAKIGDNHELAMDGIALLLIAYFNDPEDSVRDAAIEQLVEILTDDSSKGIDKPVKESILSLLIAILKFNSSERFRSTLLVKLSDCIDKDSFMSLTKNFNNDRSKWIEKTLKVILNRYNS